MALEKGVTIFPGESKCNPEMRSDRRQTRRILIHLLFSDFLEQFIQSIEREIRNSASEQTKTEFSALSPVRQ